MEVERHVEPFAPPLILLAKLGFSADVIACLEEASERVEADPDARDEFRRIRAAWPEENVAMPAGADPLLLALVVVDAFPSALQEQREAGIPFAVTARTLRDLERRMREYRQRHGTWGFDRADWMREHVRGRLFELGRLQFAPGLWREVFSVYRSHEGGGIWALADHGLDCTSDGHLRDDLHEGLDYGFRTLRQSGPDGVVGHPAEPRTGEISPNAIKLPADSHACAKGGDPVLHVHIPSGPGFSPEACVESIREARRFFEKHFPDVAYRAICCRTWLLDPALNEVLPPESNILGFGRLFRRLAVERAHDRQHIERIFGQGADWTTFQPRTRLQEAARQFLMRGGRFRITAGFVLWDDPWLA